MKHLIFVYGALRPGASNAWRMADGKAIGSGSVEGVMVKVDWYPGVVLGGGARVVGEVYEVDDELLARLDEFEGVGLADERNGEYQRVRVQVAMDNGDELETWIYEWQLGTDRYEVVMSGDWLTVKL
ncbi:MAG: gamma-glutamylcyclotransferase family protein [Verrucomicrobiota bacterium JB023]|nr:gamma-glutamylcyclotransferase family protein [Verrucomicrobiota bacterium JB023]